MSIAGAMFMGTAVDPIDGGHGHPGSGLPIAAAARANRISFIGGIVTKACEYPATTIELAPETRSADALLARALAIIASLLAHSLKGTPEPLLSTLPIVIFAPPSFLVVGILHRRCARQPQD
jgi:hypothetical protein